MDELLLFAKAPRPGLVKTRLASTLGAESACQIYRRLLAHAAARFVAVERCTVWFTPADALAEVQPLFPSHWGFQAQTGRDLGERLEHAFGAAFSAGAEKVAAVGVDCPEMDRSDLAAAWAMLDHAGVVFGPAHDGGYWLLGARKLFPELFREIDWGTDQVLRQSLARAEKAGCSVGLLRPLHDIDTGEDWHQYCRRAGIEAAAAPGLA